MSERSIRPRTLALALFIAAVLAMFGSSTASAQFQCNPIKFINSTKCEIKGNIVSPFSDIVVLFVVPPFETITVPFDLPIVRVDVMDACGVFWGQQQTGCLTNMQAASGCCFDFCLDTQTCTVTFTPAPGPCPC